MASNDQTPGAGAVKVVTDAAKSTTTKAGEMAETGKGAVGQYVETAKTKFNEYQANDEKAPTTKPEDKGSETGTGAVKVVTDAAKSTTTKAGEMVETGKVAVGQYVETAQTKFKEYQANDEKAPTTKPEDKDSETGVVGNCVKKAQGLFGK